MDHAINLHQPLTGNDPNKLGPIIQSWVAPCVTSHTTCAETLSGKMIHDRHGTKLPTRLIQLKTGSDPNIVKLVEPGRLIARYCALSHCWGPPDKRPYMTTRNNIRDISSGISVTVLPQTFQDAIAVTQAIGIDYLWIDSLCIIQGDRDDWLLESEKMGSIFERAFLVIAAAGSNDSSEGLLNMPRYPELSIHVPYYQSKQQSAGTFNMTMLSHLESQPQLGPLSSRGWASQEWHLARRVVFFMPGGISWMCREIDFDEHGLWKDFRTETPLLHFGSTREWLWYLFLYSNSHLSIHTDRLAAIQGVANEVQKRRTDRYHLGVWTKDLEAQLLWVSAQRVAEEDIPDLPSWCWASVGGRKWFLSLDWTQINYVTHSTVTSSVYLSYQTRSLIGKGIPRRASLRAGFQRIDCCCISFTVSLHCFEANFIANAYDGSIHDIYELLDDQYNFATMGLAVFDKEPYSNMFILPLISNSRSRRDPLYVIRTQQSLLVRKWSCY
jgi:hypothetical protein